jgi:CHAD domain-containing protein
MAKAKPIRGLHADMPFAEAAARTVEVRAGELLALREGVLDTSDVDRVHDMRVASRRLRAVLELYRPCFPKALLEPALRDVKALADGLGARRDPDVQLEALDRLAGALDPADRAGVELLAGRVREEQAVGNAVLAGALERAAGLDVRLRALVEALA